MSLSIPRRKTRARLAAVIVLAAGLGAAAPPAAAPPATTSPGPPVREIDDMAIGRAGARITVIEYASVGCPHCGAWARDVFPAFKAKYLDTGKARFVLREELTGDPTLAAAGFLTARCAGPGRYFQVVDAIFGAQTQMMEGGDAYGALLRIAKDAGLSEPAFTACLKDAPAVKALEERSNRHVEADKIAATPTFVVNGRKLEGEQSLAELDAAIAGTWR
ncbi:MAG: thioredoxin domain-containing protein [Caulobacteraceae bacterium]